MAILFDVRDTLFYLKFVCTFLFAIGLLLAVGCRSTREAGGASRAVVPPRLHQHVSSFEIDRFDTLLAQVRSETQGQAREAARLDLYATRWRTVQRAVAFRGTTHRDAFYGSRAYWHTGSSRGINWTHRETGDLDTPFYLDGKGSVFVGGDVNRDIEIAGNAVVHILGDLDATLELKGICEVVIGGRLTEDATIICDGQLELFVGGSSAGILGATQSSTIVIDGDAAGTIQAGAPATRLTVAGDWLAELPPPRDKHAVLTLRVQGYASSAQMHAVANAGFTRVHATLGVSDVPAGLYPKDEKVRMSRARWVVLRQLEQID